jgi:quercetin dioxygenase-like cupin family protein
VHDEEELLVLLAGEVELTLGEGERVPFRAGELLYHPVGFVHTLRTTSQDAATYVIFKWRGEAAGDEVSLSHGRFRFDGDPGVLFEGPTRYLRELHSHVTVLEPGGGYEPHVDAYDVAIVVVEGELETIGTCALPNDVVFYPAGEPHGMRNVGETPARYVVFEFHGRSTLASGAARPAAVLLARLRDRRRWRHLLQRFRRRS